MEPLFPTCNMLWTGSLYDAEYINTAIVCLNKYTNLFENIQIYIWFLMPGQIKV